MYTVQANDDVAISPYEANALKVYLSLFNN